MFCHFVPCEQWFLQAGCYATKGLQCPVWRNHCSQGKHFAVTTKTTQPPTQVFLVNGSIMCGILASQKQKNILNEIIIIILSYLQLHTILSKKILYLEKNSLQNVKCFNISYTDSCRKKTSKISSCFQHQCKTSQHSKIQQPLMFHPNQTLYKLMSLHDACNSLSCLF